MFVRIETDEDEIIYMKAKSVEIFEDKRDKRDKSRKKGKCKERMSLVECINAYCDKMEKKETPLTERLESYFK